MTSAGESDLPKSLNSQSNPKSKGKEQKDIKSIKKKLSNASKGKKDSFDFQKLDSNKQQSLSQPQPAVKMPSATEESKEK